MWSRSRHHLLPVLGAGIILHLSLRSAAAQVVVSDQNNFMNGFLHSMRVLDFIAALIVLGITFARSEDRRLLAFILFLIGLSVGIYLPEKIGLILLAFVPASLFGLSGVLLTLSDRQLRWFVVPAAAAIGGALGVALYLDGPSDEDWPWFIAGASVSVAILTFASSLIWRWLERPWMAIPRRIVGAWLVAVGFLLVGLAFRETIEM